MSRQRLILFILLIALAVAVIWSFFAMPRPKVAASLKYAPGQRTTSAKDASGRPTPAAALSGDTRVLKLDLLRHEPAVFKGYHRDIFRPIFVNEIKLMQHKAAALLPIKPPPLPPPPPVRITPPPTAAEMQAQLNRRELAKFTFKGFLRKDNQKIIFLSRDDAVLLVKKGDIIDKRYRVASITDQALTIQVTDGSEEIVIPLMENLSLTAVP